jgi:hypothetical protein
VRYDSLLERDFILILDLHPQVSTFEEQPMRLDWEDEAGAGRTYIPDVLVKFTPGIFLQRRVAQPYLCEIKNLDTLGKSWAKLKPKLRSGAAEALRNGWTFRIFTECRIRGRVLQTAEFIRKHLHGAIEPAILPDLKGLLLDGGSLTVEQVSDRVAKDGGSRLTVVQTIWTLVARGVLCTDLESAASFQSPLSKGWNFHELTQA